MKTVELRQLFLDYFRERGHEVVPSSSLVPGNDPTLLFTNSGMVQFKDVFLGQDKRPYNRAVTAQRCVRAGGKHNDLENVGYTARHHTFFEMLGNFSFGDYFKREAIHFAWTLLTEKIRLPEDRLWVTVYAEDDEAADIWLNEIGVPEERFARIGTSDNFWAMGDTGPCGPCSEIFYDHGPTVEGGPPGSEDADGDRYVELWNLVFMQFERFADGEMKNLPKPSVDTGMGLERIATVLQGVYSNYDIDLFQALIKAASTIVNTQDKESKSLRVIADHIRSAAFLITDGVLPSNEGRGYVLRRIIRRAIRHGYQLGCKTAFFHELTGPLVEQMGDAYPELRRARTAIEKSLRTEGERFSETLAQGLKLLDREIALLSDNTLPGEVAFRLYDTYGFPLDLTMDYLREQEFRVDLEGFDAAMERQRALAKSASKFETASESGPVLEIDVEFSGYKYLEQDSRIASIVANDKEIDQIGEGDSAILILSTTPFYAESGGQVGDLGTIQSGESVFQVEDTRYLANRIVGHFGKVERGSFQLGDNVSAKVNAEDRTKTMKNHSATHLLHAALKQLLGSHVQQKGSLVAPDRLRFDFSHDAPLSEQEIESVEAVVNEEIQHNRKVKSATMKLEEAQSKGAEALFGEKYESEVRVIGMGDFSLELCGGTHVDRTGDIGLFRIVGESGISSGVRRIEALTGPSALHRVQHDARALHRIAETLSSGVADVEEMVHRLLQKNKLLESEVSKLRTSVATGRTGSGGPDVRMVGDVQVLISRHDGVEIKDLRKIMDQLKSNLESGVVMLGSVHNEKATLLCSVTQDLTDRIDASEIISKSSMMLGGRGGGKKHSAQGGGSKVEELDAALKSVAQMIH